MSTVPNRTNRLRTENLLQHGVVGGTIAGIVFALAEMIMSVALGGDFFGPLRLISSMVLGTQAMDASYPLATAMLVGIVVHLILSAIYGVIFVYLLAAVQQIHTNTGLLLLYGSLFALALWVINFFVVAPIAFPQFTQVNQFWNGFVAHTFFYGTVLGGYLALTTSAPSTLRADESDYEEPLRT